VADAVGEVACAFLSGLYQAERGIAERFRRLMAGPLPWPRIDAAKALPWIERQTGLILAASQSSTLELALGTKVLLITGGPGEIARFELPNDPAWFSASMQTRRRSVGWKRGG
jgi:exodeoxyribonuclease V alpha subunit